jgi:hypothetical protein
MRTQTRKEIVAQFEINHLQEQITFLLSILRRVPERNYFNHRKPTGMVLLYLEDGKPKILFQSQETQTKGFTSITGEATEKTGKSR